MNSQDAMPKIQKGDIVEISALGINVRGKVVFVDHYGDDGWDIELTDANVKGGYSHWKQQLDGGNLVSVNGKPVT